MEIRFDPGVDAAYVQLAGEVGPGGVTRSVPVSLGNGDVDVVLDVDHHGRLIGVEVLSALRTLPPEALVSVTRVDELD